MLSRDAVERYRADGIVFPLRAFDDAAAAANLEWYQARAARITGRGNQKPHLLYPQLDRIVRHEPILDAVESVLGPDFFVWSSQFFHKPAGDPGFVSWHQDGTYWGLSSPDVVTAWVAFTPSTAQSGCMRVVPGTHHAQVPHEDTFAPDNLLSRGQEIRVDVDEQRAVDVTLAPGEFSLHHVLLFHGSNPNRAAWPRIGFAIRYVATHVHQTSPMRESATLVRGSDDFGHFDHETAPEAELHPAAVARHAEIIDRQLRILYAGARQRGRLGPDDTAADGTS